VCANLVRPLLLDVAARMTRPPGADRLRAAARGGRRGRGRVRRHGLREAERRTGGEWAALPAGGGREARRRRRGGRVRPVCGVAAAAARAGGRLRAADGAVFSRPRRVPEQVDRVPSYRLQGPREGTPCDVPRARAQHGRRGGHVTGVDGDRGHRRAVHLAAAWPGRCAWRRRDRHRRRSLGRSAAARSASPAR
jgi:hypothetical protein